MSAGAGRCLCWMYPAPGDSDPRGLQHPASHVRELGEHLAGPDPLPLLDAPGAGQPRPLRPAGHASEPGEHLASAGPLPRLDVLGTGRPDPAACWPRPRAERAPGRRRPAAAAGRARRRAAPTPAACSTQPATSASRASTWPAPTRCRCWTCQCRAAPTLATAGHVRELDERPARAGTLPGLAPWPSPWRSPEAVDLARPYPLPLLDVLGTGLPRLLRPSFWCRLKCRTSVQTTARTERRTGFHKRKNVLNISALLTLYGFPPLHQRNQQKTPDPKGSGVFSCPNPGWPDRGRVTVFRPKCGRGGAAASPARPGRRTAWPSEQAPAPG